MLAAPTTTTTSRRILLRTVGAAAAGRLTTTPCTPHPFSPTITTGGGRRSFFNDASLTPNRANHAPLTPIQWLERAATTFPSHEAIRYRPSTGEGGLMGGQVLSRTWSQTYDRSVALASSLNSILNGDSSSPSSSSSASSPNEVIQVMLPNIPEMYECHFAVPMSNAVLGCINTRLDAGSIAYVLRHSEAKVFIYDASTFGEVVKEAVEKIAEKDRPVLVQVNGSTNKDDAPIVDDEVEGLGTTIISYEDLITNGSTSYQWHTPRDEYDAIALNYTSGTTGQPKGCVLHHRGAYLTALGNILAFGGSLNHQSTRYLWTLPMFHCNGWNFPYTLAAIGGTNVCLDAVDKESIQTAIVQDGVTHLCGAPIVLDMTIEACRSIQKETSSSASTAMSGIRSGDGDATERTNSDSDRPQIQMMVAAAPPPKAVLQAAESANISVTHVYGLTEVYGPATVCEWQSHWDALSDDERASLRSRQGVRYTTLEELTVLDRTTGEPVPPDGETMGEVAMRGNQVFKGYYKNPEETSKALKNGYFHTGDLGVRCPDGYVALKDRAKDIIISGGENISSIEVENVLFSHEHVVGASVVAMPHEKWQEVGCAFVETSCSVGDEGRFEQELIAFCKERMPRFKAPHKVVVGPLPRTNTGKIQKFALRERAKGFKP